MNKDNRMFYIILTALAGGIIFLILHNFWYQDNSSYIVKGNRITGNVYIFSFSKPEMGWVPLVNGLTDSQKGIFYGLSNKSEEDRKLFKELLEKLNKLDKNLKEEQEKRKD